MTFESWTAIVKIRCCGLVLLTLTSSCARAPGTRSPGAGQPSSAAVRGARLADSLLERMTLAEKLGQLTMAPAQWGQTGPQAAGGGEDLVREGRIGSFLGWGCSTIPTGTATPPASAA